MKYLTFKRLVVISDIQKSGNLFSFHPRFNLITAKNNSYGKSTLAKLLFWTLGVDPNLDATWTALNAYCLVDFNIGDEAYQVKRNKDALWLRHSLEEWKKFPKITGDYSKYFADIVGFKALLPNRNDKTKFECPPPAFYFLPFYIDQLNSWSKAWNGFNNLKQYANWEKDIISYHTGYLLPDYFTFQMEINAHKAEQKKLNNEINQIENSINLVKSYLPAPDKIMALTQEEFEILANEANQDIANLQTKEEDLLGQIINIQTNRVYLQTQFDMAKQASIEIEKDYIFTVECIEDDFLICPLCGTEHDNSLLNRALILTDKDEANRQISGISTKIEYLEKQLENSERQLEEIRTEIDHINKKYQRTELSDTKVEPAESSFINILGLRTVDKYIEQEKKGKKARIEQLSAFNKNLKKDQMEFCPKETEKLNDDFFKKTLSQYIDDLNAHGTNLSAIKTPTDNNKLSGNGGAAENTRGILAYFMVILKLIEKAENEVFSAIVIDTPNQQEQSDFNYDNILKFLIKNVPSKAQFILCAMDGKEIHSYYKDNVNKIELDESKILKKERYEECRKLFDSI